MPSHLDSNGAGYTILASKFLSFYLHTWFAASLWLLVMRSLGVPVVSCILLQLWDSFCGFDVLKYHCVVCLGRLCGALRSVYLSSCLQSGHLISLIYPTSSPLHHCFIPQSCRCIGAGPSASSSPTRLPLCAVFSFLP